MVEQRCYMSSRDYTVRPGGASELRSEFKRHSMGVSRDLALIFSGRGPRPFFIVEVPRATNELRPSPKCPRYFNYREANVAWRQLLSTLGERHAGSIR